MAQYGANAVVVVTHGLCDGCGFLLSAKSPTAKSPTVSGKVIAAVKSTK
jgi:hypothetical protein